MKQSEKIDTIYKKAITMEEHLRGINGFVQDQKKINDDHTKQHRWFSSQINIVRGTLLAFGGFAAALTYIFKLALGI